MKLRPKAKKAPPVPARARRPYTPPRITTTEAFETATAACEKGCEPELCDPPLNS